MSRHKKYRPNEREPAKANPPSEIGDEEKRLPKYVRRQIEKELIEKAKDDGTN